MVLGASTNPSRYSYLAAKMLHEYGHETILVSNKKGDIDGVPIQREIASKQPVDTLTLYMNPQRQKPFYEDIIRLKPKRIIFNPGTENRELLELAEASGIETVDACTLVMLSTAQY